MGSNWNVRGTYFEACNCEALCPCMFLSPPTNDDCTALIGWHIDRGRQDDLALDGLNVAMAVHSPGHMVEVKWRASLYLDERASAAQRDALTAIFGGQAGGHPAVLASHVGEIVGVSSVAMEFKSEGRRHSLIMPGIAEAEIEAIEGRGGDTKVENHMLAIAPGYPATVARAKKLSYDDHGFSWELSGTSGASSPFAYQGG